MSYYHNDPANHDATLCPACGEWSYRNEDGECEECVALERNPDYQEGIGRELFAEGRPLSACQNRWQMQGWDLAQDEADKEEGE